MGPPSITRFNVERFRVVLGTDLSEIQRRMVEKLLAECEADLARMVGDATDLPSFGVVPPLERYSPVKSDALGERIPEPQPGLASKQRPISVRQPMSELLREVTQPLTAIATYVTACRRLVALGEYENIDITLEQVIDQIDSALRVVQELRALQYDDAFASDETGVSSF
jgi:hypothetical protein